jgi:hypothetical protein
LLKEKYQKQKKQGVRGKNGIGENIKSGLM